MAKKIKNFDDILQFLSDDSEHIISQLKKKKTFINDWIDVFFKEKPIIEPSVKWEPSNEYHPVWANKVFKLAKEICQNCKFYDNKCTNNNELNHCLEEYSNFITFHARRIEKVNDFTLKVLVNKIEQVLHGSDVYVSDKKVEYSTEINSGKFDPRKIRKRIIKLYEAKNEDLIEKNKIIRDMKRYIHEFPLLKTEIDRDESYYEDEFNDVIRITENHTKNYNYDKIHKSVFIYASLFYLFFWDFLNKTKLRDCPNAYEVELKTDQRELWIAEADIVFRPKGKTQEEVETKANLTELPNYDPAYKQTHFYLFEHENVPIEKIFEFADKLNSLVSYQKLSSITNQDLPEDVRTMFKTLIKKKKMLKIPLISDNRGNINYRECEESDLKRYFTYQSYKLLITFLFSVSKTKLRKKKPSIPREKIELLLKKIKQYPSYNLTELIEKYNIGKYSTVMDILNNNIEDHPNYDKNKGYDLKGKAKEIIIEATNNQNKLWLDGIYSGN